MSEAIFKAIKNHRSIRKYQKKEIPKAKLEKILDAATMASTSGNMQAYSIIVTKDRDMKRDLLEPHFNQSMVVEAPVLLTFCADFHRMRRWLEISKAPPNFDNFMSFMIGAIDAILASQNAALAAEAEGLGICYMGTTLASCERIGKILKCPEHVVPVVGLSLGYPDEKPGMRKRLPLNGVVHKEVYCDPSDSEVTELYSEKESEGMKRYRSIPELREKIETEGVENLAQVYTRLKYTRESHIDYSKTVLSYLKDQGFL